MTRRGPYQVLAFSTKLKVHDLLLKVCDKTGAKSCKYKEGWDDQRVANEVGLGTTLKHVNALRVEVMGRLPTPTDQLWGGNNGPLARRIVALEEDVAKLKAYLTYLDVNWPNRV